MKLRQNRSYAITNTPEQITRTFISGGCQSTMQLNLAPSRQEVKYRNKNIKSSYFSKQTQALLLILRSGILPVVFMTHTYNCGRE